MHDALTALNRFLAHITMIWHEYQWRGPGQLDAELSDGVDQLMDSCAPLLRTDSELEQAATAARKLADRCVTWPQGLCFVTGEAGMVPRRDQHQAMESALKTISEKLSQLGHQSLAPKEKGPAT